MGRGAAPPCAKQLPHGKRSSSQVAAGSIYEARADLHGSKARRRFIRSALMEDPASTRRRVGDMDYLQVCSWMLPPLNTPAAVTPLLNLIRIVSATPARHYRRRRP